MNAFSVNLNLVLPSTGSLYTTRRTPEVLLSLPQRDAHSFIPGGRATQVQSCASCRGPQLEGDCLAILDAPTSARAGEMVVDSLSAMKPAASFVGAPAAPAVPRAPCQATPAHWRPSVGYVLPGVQFRRSATLRNWSGGRCQLLRHSTHGPLHRRSPHRSSEALRIPLRPRDLKKCCHGSWRIRPHRGT